MRPPRNFGLIEDQDRVMKPRLSLILFIICACLMALLLVQWRSLREHKQLNQKLQLQVEKMQGEIQASQTRVAQAESARAALQTQVEAMALNMASPQRDITKPAESSTGRAAATSSAGQEQRAPSAGANPMRMMAEMMKNPETREAFKQQQQFALNMMYDPLFKKLGLTEEEEKAFKEVLVEQHMSNMEMGVELMDQGSTNREELMEKMAAEKKRREEEMKAIIGEERYAEVEDYTITMGDRMMLNQQMQLPPEQMEQLMGIIAEERRALQMTQMPGMDPSLDPALIMEEGFVEQQMANQETVNAHVYERARAILTPEQLKNLEEFQRNQQTLTKSSLEMARKFMQPDEGLAPALPPVATEQ